MTITTTMQYNKDKHNDNTIQRNTVQLLYCIVLYYNRITMQYNNNIIII